MTQNNSICHLPSVNSGFQFLFTHSTILTWQFSRMGPLRSQESVNITLPAEGILLNLMLVMTCLSTPCFDVWYTDISSPVTIRCRKTSPPSRYRCKKSHAHFHAFLFVLICKLLWHPPCTTLCYPRSSWIVEQAGPQLMSSLSAMSVTVICLSSWNRALTRSTLPAVREVVGSPERSSSTVLVLIFWNISTHWYTFLRLVQFSLYRVNFLLFISKGFIPSHRNNRMTTRCSTLVQSKNGVDIFTLSLYELHRT